MNRLERIRREEKTYHDDCYERNRLFEPGTWLHQPVRTVLDLLSLFQDYEHFRALDLGSGIGRNSIPIAEFIKDRSGKIVCVDLLTSAIDGLMAYGKQYEVDSCIEPVQSDIEQFAIARSEYDLIVAVSALEHVSTERALARKLAEMAAGTKPNGINCVVIGSNIRETVEGTGEALDPMFEVNLPTEEMMALLDEAYDGWDIRSRLVKPLEYMIERDGTAVRLTSDCITFAARKPQ